MNPLFTIMTFLVISSGIDVAFLQLQPGTGDFSFLQYIAVNGGAVGIIFIMWYLQKKTADKRETEQAAQLQKNFETLIEQQQKQNDKTLAIVQQITSDTSLKYSELFDKYLTLNRETNNHFYQMHNKMSDNQLLIVGSLEAVNKSFESLSKKLNPEGN